MRRAEKEGGKDFLFPRTGLAFNPGVLFSITSVLCGVELKRHILPKGIVNVNFPSNSQVEATLITPTMSSSRLPPSLMKAAVQATPLTTSAAVTSRTGAVLRRSSAAAAAVSQRATLPPAARFSTISQRQSLEQLRQRFSSIPGISQRQWQQLQQRVYSTESETKQEEQAKEERPHKVYDFEAVGFPEERNGLGEILMGYTG